MASKRGADFGLVSVDRSAIEMAVTHRGRATNRLGNLGRGDVVGAEGAQADGWHGGACMQLSLWDGCGGDDFCLAHAVILL
jgi:hypothetical protein